MTLCDILETELSEVTVGLCNLSALGEWCLEDRVRKVWAKSKVDCTCKLCFYDSNLYAFSLR